MDKDRADALIQEIGNAILDEPHWKTSRGTVLR